MHANNVETHDALTRSACDLVAAWEGTDPMHSEEEVRRALVATNPWHGPADDATVDEFLPYLVDACRGAGLLLISG